jgi:hypothetical protein
MHGLETLKKLNEQTESREAVCVVRTDTTKIVVEDTAIFGGFWYGIWRGLIALKSNTKRSCSNKKA